MKTIAVTGTPCTGKTTYSKKLANKKKYFYINLNDFIKENKLREKYDRKRKTYEVDVKKLNKKLISFIKKFNGKGIVIDGHLSHYLPKKYVNKVIIVKTSLKNLKKRLEKRGYNKLKVRENLEAEIFDVCFEEAKELGHKVEVVEN